jgi:hypothetical protein
MVVLITNVTDAPGGKHSPAQVDIYNKKLDPGASMKIPADLVNKRLRSLANEGLIAIGALPSWYTAAKTRASKRLTAEEKQRRLVIPPPVLKKDKPAPKVSEDLSKLDEDPNRKR